MAPASLRRRMPFILVMGAIFFLSHLPGNTLAAPVFPYSDKVAHLVVYALLAASLLHALPRAWRDWHLSRITLLVVLFCLAYGMSDEWHQSFIPGREASALDLLADVLGACLAMVIYGLWENKKGSKRKKEQNIPEG